MMQTASRLVKLISEKEKISATLLEWQSAQDSAVESSSTAACIADLIAEPAKSGRFRTKATQLNISAAAHFSQERPATAAKSYSNARLKTIRKRCVCTKN